MCCQAGCRSTDSLLILIRLSVGTHAPAPWVLPPQAAAPQLRVLRLEAMGIHYCGAWVGPSYCGAWVSRAARAKTHASHS